MKHIEITTNNENETLELGKKLASYLKKGDIVVLTGELGSGKTKLTEGLLTYFGLENEISSPTFTLVNEYIKDDIKIFHFDVYRLEDSSEFYAIGGEEYFENGICIIEWGEIIQDALPEEYIHIILKKDDINDNIRLIDVTSYGHKYDYILTDLLEGQNENFKHRNF